MAAAAAASQVLWCSARALLALALLPLAFAWVYLADLINRVAAARRAPPDAASASASASADDNVVLITGTSSGIGRAAAVCLATTYKCTVFAGVRSPKHVDQIRRESASIRPVLLDVTDQTDVVEAFRVIREFLEAKPGRRLIGVINNAGIVVPGPFETVDFSLTQKVLEVNTLAPMHIAHTFLPLLRKYQGSLVNIGSISGRCPTMQTSSYSASKFALRGWSLAIRQELEPLGVSVSLVEPGPTSTGMYTTFLNNPSVVQGPYSLMIDMCNKFVQFSSTSCPSVDSVTRAIVHALFSSNPLPVYLPAWNAVLSVAAGLLPESLPPSGLLGDFYKIANGVEEGWDLKA